MAVKTAIRDLLWDEYLEKEEPVVLFGTFADYERTADLLSRGASDTLIWSLHGTPLALMPADTDYLTPSDIFFRDHRCLTKVRVVVFENGRDLDWYVKARRHWKGEKVSTWRRKVSLEQAAARVKAFEEAAAICGKLLFTATDILDRQLNDYKYSKLDAGYISSTKGQTYCFHSSLLLRARPAIASSSRQERIVLFKLSGSNHKEIPARPFYKRVLDEVARHPNGNSIFFLDPAEVKSQVRTFVWPVKRTLEKTKNWFVERGHWLWRNKSTLNGILGWLALIVALAVLVAKVVLPNATICENLCAVRPPEATAPSAADGEKRPALAETTP